MKYLFCSFYRTAVFIRREGDPEARAWMVFSASQVFNLYSITQLFNNYFFNIKINFSASYAVLSSLLILFNNFIFFLHKGKYLIIENQLKNKRKVVSIAGCIYVISTVILLY